MAHDSGFLGPLFRADDADWASNACLNFGNPEIGYVTGFRKAADLAVEHVRDTARDQDYLVYPIVFGYRQYLELRLKGLLRDATQLLEASEPSTRLMGRHRLGPIWDALRPLLDQIFPDDDEQLDLIGSRVAEFDAVDPDSFSFRYATTKRGEPSLPDNLRHINLARLQEGVAAIAGNLDGADVGIGVYLERKSELDEYADDFLSSVGGYSDV